MAGRPSKLTPAQWDEITRRAGEGEAPSKLAVEFKITKRAINARVSSHTKTVKSLVDQVVSLPAPSQRALMTLVDRENAKRQNLAIIGHEGTAMAARLVTLAREKVDTMRVLPPAEDLRDVAAATQVMNAAASMGQAQAASAKETTNPNGPNTAGAMGRLKALVDRRSKG